MRAFLLLLCLNQVDVEFAGVDDVRGKRGYRPVLGVVDTNRVHVIIMNDLLSASDSADHIAHTVDISLVKAEPLHFLKDQSRNIPLLVEVTARADGTAVEVQQLLRVFPGDKTAFYYGVPPVSWNSFYRMFSISVIASEMPTKR